MIRTQALVLSSLKYAESSLIIRCFTRNYGHRVFIQRGVLKSKNQSVMRGYLQPMMFLEILASDNPPNGKMGTIKEARPLYSSFSFYSNSNKRAICFFLSELLTKVLREEAENESLFEYLYTNLKWLESNNDIVNFYAPFLINLTKYMGFYPNNLNIDKPFFDLQEGVFSSYRQKNSIEGSDLELFKKLLSSDFDSFVAQNLSRNQRKQLLNIIISYYKMHIQNLGELYSIDVLSEVYNS